MVLFDSLESHLDACSIPNIVRRLFMFMTSSQLMCSEGHGSVKPEGMSAMPVYVRGC